jgi:hypothetical protein
MRKLLVLILVSFSFLAKSQVPAGLASPNSTGFAKYGYLKTDSAGIAALRDTSFNPKYAGTWVYWQNAGVDSSFWVFNGKTTGRKWGKVVMVTSTGTGYVMYSDTSAMLSPYLRKYDTTAMLSKYLRTYDTTAMLAGYIRDSKIGVTVQPYNANTTLLGNTTTGSGGTIVLSGSPTLTLPSFTGVQVSGGIAAMPTGSGTLAYTRDTGRTVSAFATGGSLNKVKDSLVGLIAAGGFGTVLNVSTTDGVGIVSSVATPTSTPNISIRVDTGRATAQIVSGGTLKKVTDSLGLVVSTADALKLNISDTAAMLYPNYRRSNIKITNSDLVNSTISGTALGSNLPALSFGTYLQSGALSYNGTTANTITTNATSSNLGTTLVARDLNGDFAARNISASLVGNASSASTVSVTNDNTTNATMYPLWSAASSGNNSPKVSSSKITFNPNTGVLTSNFTGALTGNATTASTLQTPRTINGVAFDGSANISISASVDSSLSAGYGITGSPFNGSLGRTWVVDTTKIIPYTDTLKSWGIATKSNVYSKQNTIYANVKDYGAIGDGTTDDRAAFVAAFASGLPVFVPQGKFYLSSTITLTDYQTIRGVGDSSIICLKTGNYPAITIGGSYIKISDLSIRGKGRGTATNYATLYPNQHGIYLLGQVGIAGARYNIDVSRCYFDSLGGAGIKIEENRGIYYQPMVNVYDCRASESWAGFMTGNRAEYNNFNNCNASLCEYGFYNQGGNNSFVGGMSNYNKCLFYLKKGDNDGHGNAVGMILNHAQDVGVWGDSLQVGFTFSACELYYSNIVLNYSFGIRFDACDMQVANIYAAGSTGIVFNNTHYYTTPVFVLDYLGDSSDVRFFGNNWTATPAAGIYNEVKNNLKVPVAASKILKTDANSLVVEAVAGTDYQAPITNPITGTGTSGYISKWNSSSSIASSSLQDDGTNVSLGGSPTSGGATSKWFSVNANLGSAYSGGILYKTNDTLKGIDYSTYSHKISLANTGLGSKIIVNGSTDAIIAESNGTVTIPSLSTSGIVLNSSSGLLSTTTKLNQNQIDTNQIATRLRVQKGIDSVAALIPTSIGTVTSVATNSGSGITGGTITSTGTIAADTTILSTKANVTALLLGKGVGSVTSIATDATMSGGIITSSGTLKVDTVVIATRPRVQKGIDSLGSVKQNLLSGTTNYLPKFTGVSTLGNSAITDDGTTVNFNSRSLLGTGNITATGSGNSFYNVNNGASFGGSGGDYASVGYNVIYSTTTNSYTRRYADAASMWQFYNGGAILKGAATSSAGSSIAFTDLITISNAGSLTATSLVKSGATSSEALKGDGSTTTLTSGTYSPTFTTSTNVASGSASTAQYMRVGNVVTVSGEFTMTSSSSGATQNSSLFLSIPINSDFTAAEGAAGGTAVTSNGNGGEIAQAGAIGGDSTGNNNRVLIMFAGTNSTSARVYRYSYTYRVQ